MKYVFEALCTFCTPISIICFILVTTPKFIVDLYHSMKEVSWKELILAKNFRRAAASPKPYDFLKTNKQKTTMIIKLYHKNPDALNQDYDKELVCNVSLKYQAPSIRFKFDFACRVSSIADNNNIPRDLVFNSRISRWQRQCNIRQNQCSTKCWIS